MIKKKLVQKVKKTTELSKKEMLELVNLINLVFYEEQKTIPKKVTEENLLQKYTNNCKKYSYHGLTFTNNKITSCYSVIPKEYYFFNKKLNSIKKGPIWLVGPKNYITGHSLGSLIKKNLHNKFGLYSLDLKIASDTLFLLKVIRGGSNIIHCNKEIGIFGENGISNQKYFRASYEHMLAHYKSGSNIFLQLMLFTIIQIYLFVRYYILSKIF